MNRPGGFDTVREGPAWVVRGAVEDDELFARLLQEWQADGTCVVDLSEVTFFPSGAVAAVVSASIAARDKDQEVVVVSRPGSIAQRVLSLCGLPVHTSGSLG